MTQNLLPQSAFSLAVHGGAGTILRSSTAAVTAAGLLSHWRAQQTGAPS